MGPFEGLGPDIVEGIHRIKSQDGPDLIRPIGFSFLAALLEAGIP